MFALHYEVKKTPCCGSKSYARVPWEHYPKRMLFISLRFGDTLNTAGFHWLFSQSVYIAWVQDNTPPGLKSFDRPYFLSLSRIWLSSSPPRNVGIIVTCCSLSSHETTGSSRLSMKEALGKIDEKRNQRDGTNPVQFCNSKSA